MDLTRWIEYSEEVQRAKENQQPIVALESTIISHGMPYPVNIETAKAVEDIIRSKQAVPATIAILNGKIKVGLSEDELHELANSEQVFKVSRRDLPYVLSTKKHGATTVAATMICAQLAGIKVFVTGGIGGVHRGAEVTMDISADLLELSETNVAVVCAGAKSILDIGRTLEYLETHGVPVLGYQTSELPAFYSRKSGFNVDYQMNSPHEVASFLQTKWELGLKGGVVIANPVPEKDELEQSYIESIIQNALKEADELHITGKNTTPFLLDKIKQLSGGKSLDANVALVKHNATIGAEIAKELHALSH